MSRRPPVQYNDDDGRTIADMSDLPSVSPFRFKGLKNRGTSHADHSRASATEADTSSADRSWEDHSMSRAERRAYIGAAIGATLLIGSIYVVCFGLLIWLITLIAH